MSSFRSALVVAVAVLALSARPARAFDVTEVYDGVRDVIEDLVKANVAKTIASKMQAEHPALCFYFRGAFELMQSRDWGGVPGQLREGLISMSADFIVWHVDATGDPEQDFYERITRFVETRNRQLTPRAKDPEGSCTERQWSGQQTLVEQCPKQGSAEACLLGRLGFSLLNHHFAKAINDVRDYVISTIGAQYTEIAKLAISGTKSLQAYSERFTELAGLLQKLSPITSCTFALTDATSPCWYLDLADLVSDAELLVSLTVARTPPDAPVTYTAKTKLLELPRLLRGSTTEVFTDPAGNVESLAVLLATFGTTRPPECDGAGLAGKLKLVVPGGQTFRPIDFCVRAGPRYPTPELLFLRELTSGWSYHRELLTEQLAIFAELGLPFPDRSLAAVRKAVTELLRLERSIDVLKASVSSLGELKQDARLDDLLKAITDVLCLSAITGITKPRTGCSNGVVEKIQQLRAGGAYQMVIRLIDTRNYRGFGVAALRTLTTAGRLAAKLEEKLSDQEIRFLKAFASYVFTDASGEDARTIARQALRSAVQELLLETGRGFPTRTNRLLRRPRCDRRSAVSWVGCKVKHGFQYPVYSVVPVLALRWEFGDQWHDRSADGIRRAVSLDALAISVPIKNYGGLRVSALDLLAPATELALRDPMLKYDHRVRVLGEILRPRLDLWAGIPQLTRKLSVSVGAAASFLQRERSSDGTRVSYDLDLARPHFSINFGVLIWL